VSEFHLLTLFPELLSSALAPTAGLLGKAQASGVIRVQAHDLRTFGIGSYNRLDDDPYGGGAGLLMRADAWSPAIASVREKVPGVHVVLLGPDGPPLSQSRVRALAAHSAIALLCPRYEGVDERVRALVDEELSLGDFVLSGGEYAALCVIDAVTRLLPGALGNSVSTDDESFAHPGRLEYAQYTRPPEVGGARVPAVLLSGNHQDIARWRLGSQVARTIERRPDLLARWPLSREELGALEFYRTRQS
jgi:tRNA (guanine37-N1)-methyltransferase